jgi:SAM-dependent methyltransferase
VAGISSDPSIMTNVASYYASKLATYGATPHGVDWNGQDSHDKRHRQFLRLLDGATDATILDLGCGYGDFLRFLRGEGYRGLFIGYDVATSMIAEAARIHGQGPDRRWRVGATPIERTDFAIASGIFNVKGDVPIETWGRHIHETIDLLSRIGRRGFAFNVLSLSSDPERRTANLYYADPRNMFSHCLLRYGRSVAILQDYDLYEFTIVVRNLNSAA